jgi:hypothetical protein
MPVIKEQSYYVAEHVNHYGEWTPMKSTPVGSGSDGRREIAEMLDFMQAQTEKGEQMRLLKKTETLALVCGLGTKPETVPFLTSLTQAAPVQNKITLEGEALPNED